MAEERSCPQSNASMLQQQTCTVVGGINIFKQCTAWCLVVKIHEQMVFAVFFSLLLYLTVALNGALPMQCLLPNLHQCRTQKWNMKRVFLQTWWAFESGCYFTRVPALIRCPGVRVLGKTKFISFLAILTASMPYFWTPFRARVKQGRAPFLEQTNTLACYASRAHAPPTRCATLAAVPFSTKALRCGLVNTCAYDEMSTKVNRTEEENKKKKRGGRVPWQD